MNSISTRNLSPYVALAPILLGVFIAADDQTVVVTVLPQIMLDMKVTVTELDRASWTITGYLLGYLAAMPLIGRLSDVWGHRRMFALSLLVFMVGSVAVAMSPALESLLPIALPDTVRFPNFELLIVARVFQAIGAGALIPISIALASDLFPTGKRGLPFGLIGASAEAGGVIGPFWGAVIPRYMDNLWDLLWTTLPIIPGLTGWLNQPQGWRWVFWINIPLSLVILGLVIWLVAPGSKTSTRIDYLGGLLITLSLATLTAALARIGSPDILMLALTAISIGSLYMFIRRQLTHPQPIVPLTMFREAKFSAANGVHILVGSALIIGMVTIPLMANTVMGLSPFEGGLWLMRMTAAMPVGAIIGGLACQRFGYRLPILSGLILSALGYGLLGGWDTLIQDPELTIHLAIVGLGFGLLIAPIGLAAVDSVGEGERGVAAGIVTATRIIGMTLGLAALTAWGTGRFGGLVSNMRLPLPVTGETSAELQRRISEFNADITVAGVTVFNEFFYVAMVLCLAAILPAILMNSDHAKSLGKN